MTSYFVAPRGSSGVSGRSDLFRERVHVPVQAGFTYDPHEHTFFTTITTYSHSAMPSVFSAGAFHIVLLFHILIWASFKLHLLDWYVDPEGPFHFKLADMQPISAITIYFEVFYTHHCYDRYVQLHHAVNEVFRCSQAYCQLLKEFCGDAGPEYLWLPMRWLRVSLVTFFIDLRDGKIHDQCWVDMVCHGLVNKGECDLLRSLNSAQRSLVLMHWIGRVTMMGYHEAKFNNPPCLKGLLDRLVRCDEMQKEILNLHRLPIPFQYYHLVNLMVCVSLVLWAYALALTDSVFGPVVFFFACIISIGMVELAKSLSDPFGTDEVDFPVHFWLAMCMENERGFLNHDDYGRKKRNFMPALEAAKSPVRIPVSRVGHMLLRSMRKENQTSSSQPKSSERTMEFVSGRENSVFDRNAPWKNPGISGVRGLPTPLTPPKPPVNPPTVTHYYVGGTPVE